MIGALVGVVAAGIFVLGDIACNPRASQKTEYWHCVFFSLVFFGAVGALVQLSFEHALT